MGVIDIVHLLSHNRYKITRASSKPEWPDRLFTKYEREDHAFSMVQNPVFIQAPPGVFDEWPTLEAACPLTHNLKSKRQVMLVEGNFRYPLTHQPPLSDDVRMAYRVINYQKMLRTARDRASQNDFSQQTRRTVFLVLTGLAVVLTLFVVLVVAQNVWFSDAEEFPITTQNK